jgi:hypothetical protein
MTFDVAVDPSSAATAAGATFDGHHLNLYL